VTGMIAIAENRSTHPDGPLSVLMVAETRRARRLGARSAPALAWEWKQRPPAPRGKTYSCSLTAQQERQALTSTLCVSSRCATGGGCVISSVSRHSVCGRELTDPLQPERRPADVDGRGSHCASSLPATRCVVIPHAPAGAAAAGSLLETHRRAGLPSIVNPRCRIGRRVASAPVPVAMRRTLRRSRRQPAIENRANAR
jgi:hypothetical protein